jgi:ureidoglycolate hydrolase
MLLWFFTTKLDCLFTSVRIARMSPLEHPFEISETMRRNPFGSQAGAQ